MVHRGESAAEMRGTYQRIKSSSDSGGTARTDYDYFYSRRNFPHMSEETHEEQRRLMTRLSNWAITENNENSSSGSHDSGSSSECEPVDPVLLLLFSKILLFSNENGDLALDRPAEAERLRERYCEKLWRYFEAKIKTENESQDQAKPPKDRRSNDRARLAARFGRALSLLPLIRKVLEISQTEKRRAMQTVMS